MIHISVRREAKWSIARFEADHRGKINKATVRALNRAIDSSQTAASREIRKTYNIKARAVRRAMKKKRAHRGQVYPYAELEINGALIPLIEFDARWTQKTKIGASVRIKKAGGRKRIKGAFIGVHGHTGARQVFVRVGQDRYPIKSLRSLSLPQAFRSRVVFRAVQLATRESFTKNFQQQLKFLKAH